MLGGEQQKALWGNLHYTCPLCCPLARNLALTGYGAMVVVRSSHDDNLSDRASYYMAILILVSDT